MSRTRPILFATLLASLSVIGIVGMLLADGATDAAFLALAAVPVVLGLVRLKRGGRL